MGFTSLDNSHAAVFFFRASSMNESTGWWLNIWRKASAGSDDRSCLC
jgi:hypothetical protein